MKVLIDDYLAWDGYIFKGELPSVPREGEFVISKDGQKYKVQEVFWDVPDNADGVMEVRVRCNKVY